MATVIRRYSLVPTWLSINSNNTANFYRVVSISKLVQVSGP